MPGKHKPVGANYPPMLRKGIVLEAEAHWNTAVALMRKMGVSVQWPLMFSPSGQGGVFSVDIDTAEVGTLARIKTTSAITARSGTTAGSGSATLVAHSGTTLSTGASVTIYSISGKAGGTGLYGWANREPDGTYWLIDLECP
jgi:hypothetical protein